MRQDVEFWFDFGSPYAYFAAQVVEARLARFDRTVIWRPFLLGAAFQATGMKPLAATPMRGAYARRDWDRIARLHGIPFRQPGNAPLASQAAARCFYWLVQAHPNLAIPFAKAAFRAYHADGADIAPREAVLRIAAPFLAGDAQLAAWLGSDHAREVLREVSAEALDRGIFGSPFFIADGEPFWGFDRIAMLEDWLGRGAWPTATEATP
jgi:2-hydroxychromene-2-carboxylate isomerase